MNLSPEEREIGRDNYYEAVGVNRREFMTDIIGAGAVTGAGLGAMYFGYGKVKEPVRVGIIGTGDEGNVLIGAVTPAYIQVNAIADIRPSSIHRAFHGDWASPAATAARPGLMAKYGWKSEDQARKNVKVYDQSNGGYEELLKDKSIQAVVIALPLHLHAKVAIQAMKAGKHVLTEKLMAHNVAQCKVMSRAANSLKKHLATGHQRHYSVLYDNAVSLLQWGILGEIHHIRAQWHRGNLPGRDSWQQPLPGGEMATDLDGKKYLEDRIADAIVSLKRAASRERNPKKRELLEKKVAQWTKWDSDKSIKAEDFGYENITLANGRERSALEELCRWRLWQRTGGGLMAELGSHQLDAASIFISAMRKDKKKVHPLTVHAVSGRHTFPLDRDADDHVYCTFEFPGPGYDAKFDVGYFDPIANVPHPEHGVYGYEKDANKKIVVTYSSINGNGYGGYGEVVMGTKGTMILEKEKEVMLFKASKTRSRVKVRSEGGSPILDTQASGESGPVAKAAEGPVSRGYTEEMEHWAYCISNGAPVDGNEVRCKPEVALGDAVIALTANVAARKSHTGEGGFIKFDEEWFQVDADATPDGSDVKKEQQQLG